MTNQKIKERFYFCYSKPESDYLKERGFFYITKAIHPDSKVTFCMYDQSEQLSQAIKEYREQHKCIKI
jgi:hypothetical protein